LPMLVGTPRVQDDESSLIGVRDVRVRLRADMDACEVTSLAALVLESSDDLGPHIFPDLADGRVRPRSGLQRGRRPVHQSLDAREQGERSGGVRILRQRSSPTRQLSTVAAQTEHGARSG
jgi:hypothetical protein